MTILRRTIITSGTLVTAFLTFTPYIQARTPSLTTLYSFTGNAGDGGSPSAAVALGKDGVLYGTTTSGGTANAGTVYSLTPPTSPSGTWTETVLYSFTGSPDGAGPSAAVAIGKDGVLYGTTVSGGVSNAGTVFSLTPPVSPATAWTESVLHSFAGGKHDGESPHAGLAIQGNTLYGTTSAGGAKNAGTVFTVTVPKSGTPREKVIYDFLGGSADGANPYAAVTIGAGGDLYGTTSQGGTSSHGTVFSLTPPVSPSTKWTEAVLYSFAGGTDGAAPYGSVAISLGPVLYGTTSQGGASSHGTVFSLTPPASPGTWNESVLYSFAGGGDGENPKAGVVIGAAGVLYGTTAGSGSNYGTVFSLAPTSPSAWTEAVQYTFTGGSDGGYPMAGLAIGKGGVLLGTTQAGGTAGTVFSLTGSISTITVKNASFESPALPLGGFNQAGPITDWNSLTGGAWGVWHPPIPELFYSIPNGVQLAYTNGGTLSQTLTTKLENSTTYILTVDIGSRLDGGSNAYEVQLLAGGAVLASDNNTVRPSPGAFGVSTVVYTSLASDPNAGQKLEIALSNPGDNQADFDNVQFVSYAVPVPAPKQDGSPALK